MLGKCAFLVVLLLYMIPLVGMMLLAFDTSWIKEKKNRVKGYVLVGVIGLCVNIVMLLLVHKVIQKSWSFLQTFQFVWDMNLSYQEVIFFPISMVGCLVVSIGMGLMFRVLFYNVAKETIETFAVNSWKIAIFKLFGCVFSLGVLYSLYLGFSGTQNVIISEVDAEFDYIELYNKGNLACNIHGLYLSDEASDLMKKEIPFERLPAKGYTVVYLEENDFSIRQSGGEQIYLSEGNDVLDKITTLETKAGVSTGRIKNSDKAVLVHSSARIENVQTIAEIPEFSHTSGFYENEFMLALECPKGYSIYYTLDGSVPSVDATLYEDPIRVYDKSDEPNVYRSVKNVVENWYNRQPSETPVDKAFIVRAIVVDENGIAGECVTATYFVDLEEYQDTAVISLVGDPDDIWGEDGIYVTGKEYDDWYLNGQTGDAPLANFSKRGREYEVPAEFSFFSEDLTFSQKVGLRIAGGSTRKVAIKSFNLYARREYTGSSVFDENIFEGVSSHKLSLRGGYANAICQAIINDRNVATQNTKRVSVFLNGEFWYDTYLIEKYDARYFEEYYGLNKDDVVVFNQGEITEGIPEDTEMYRDIHRYLEANELDSAETYAGFGEIVDIQSYIDYMCINIYIDNMDFTEIKNTIVWRSKENKGTLYEDGKWRYCLYDLDAMEWDDARDWGLASQAQKNSFSLMPKFTGNVPINQQEMYIELRKNENFNKQFVLTFMDLVNTCFQYDYVLQVMEKEGMDIVGLQGGNGGNRDITYYKEFFENRADYIVEYLAEEFDLNGSLERLTVDVNDVNAGTIIVNTVSPDLSEGIWTGEYYTDYPVTVTAVANPGYKFVRWSGSEDSTETAIEVTLGKGGARLNAIFEKIN